MVNYPADFYHAEKVFWPFDSLVPDKAQIEERFEQVEDPVVLWPLAKNKSNQPNVYHSKEERVSRQTFSSVQ